MKICIAANADPVAAIAFRQVAITCTLTGRLHSDAIAWARLAGPVRGFLRPTYSACDRLLRTGLRCCRPQRLNFDIGRTRTKEPECFAALACCFSSSPYFWHPGQ